MILPQSPTSTSASKSTTITIPAPLDLPIVQPATLQKTELCFPFIGLVISDITKIDEASPDYAKPPSFNNNNNSSGNNTGGGGIVQMVEKRIVCAKWQYWEV